MASAGGQTSVRGTPEPEPDPVSPHGHDSLSNDHVTDGQLMHECMHYISGIREHY